MLNRYLAPFIMISKIERVDDDFHARYSAKKRSYRYIVSSNRKDVFMHRYVKFVDHMDADLMQKAVGVFEGEHDFEYFKKSDPSKNNFVRTIYKSRFYQHKDLNIFYFEANGFLKSQIRIMMGFLLKINDGKLSIDNLKDQLEKKRFFSNTLESASGLYLCRIKY
jgi:tRNA pseudouridine38-40 synthase